MIASGIAKPIQKQVAFKNTWGKELAQYLKA